MAIQKMTGRQAFIKLLLDEGVTHMFGNPGTTELAIMEAVPQFPELTYVLGLQESIVVGMADGFARATNKLIDHGGPIRSGLWIARAPPV
jgi:benzoylformate decarboxylase